MSFIFSTPESIRNMCQLRMIVFPHWCLMRAVPLSLSFCYNGSLLQDQGWLTVAQKKLFLNKQKWVQKKKFHQEKFYLLPFKNRLHLIEREVWMQLSKPKFFGGSHRYLWKVDCSRHVKTYLHASPISH